MWLSSGELCRNSGDPEILEIIRGAKLVPEELINKMVLTAINENSNKGIILDGYPRNFHQCEVLDENNVEIDLILEIEVPKEELLARAALRGRDQDTEDVVMERIEMYRKSRDEIFDYYNKKGTQIITVNGVGDIEEVAKRIEVIIG